LLPSRSAAVADYSGTASVCGHTLVVMFISTARAGAFVKFWLRWMVCLARERRPSVADLEHARRLAADRVGVFALLDRHHCSQDGDGTECWRRAESWTFCIRKKNDPRRSFSSGSSKYTVAGTARGPRRFRPMQQ